MSYQQDRSRGLRSAMFTRLQRTIGLVLAGVALTPVVGSISVARAQQPEAATPLVFDGVTVIDVQQGRRLRAQRVVIVGNRIRTMGSVHAVRVPAGARVVNARGKYLIPGLWDMHVHPARSTDVFYPLFIANGVTGIRDASSPVPLDTQIMWRREILAGTLVGPPRQILSGSAIDERELCKRRANDFTYGSLPITGQDLQHTCVADAADARHLVDSLKTAGADMIKTYDLSRSVYFAIAAEARRIGILFGGHLKRNVATAMEASDSGATILDHANSAGDLGKLCLGTHASAAQCQLLAERFRRNDTWWVPTFTIVDLFDGNLGPPSEPDFIARHRSLAGDTVLTRWREFVRTFWSDSTHHLDLRHGPTGVLRVAGGRSPSSSADTIHWGDMCGVLCIMHRVGLPILAGTDVTTDGVYDDAFDSRGFPPGFSLHTELAIYVAEGLTPLEALQTATLNPAKAIRGTDSLGTVSPGKLADLVLLDGDPLKDITNTTAIRAVVANGRYFDRATLDQLLLDAQTKDIQRQKQQKQ
jgi:hypothetical protein